MTNPRKTMWTTLRSLIQWGLGLVVFGILAFFVLVFGNSISRKKLHSVLGSAAWLLKRISLCTVSVHGKEKLSDDQSYFFVINHTNYLDHVFIYDSLGPKIRGVEAASHFHWPIYGRFMRIVGQIPIASRKYDREFNQTVAVFQECFEKGISVVMAPEGDFTRDGKLLPFKMGAFYFAIRTKKEIVPVILVGMYSVMRKGDWRIYPGHVDIYIEDPISTQENDLNDVDALCERTREKFLKVLSGS